VLKRLCIALLAIVLLPLTAQARPHGGTLTPGSYTAPGGLTRSYLLYQPAKLRPHQPLVVYLHGCNQRANEAMTSSGWNSLADKEGFAVLYPEQVQAENSSAPLADGNGIRCWNWFLPDDQQRDRGEPAVLAGMTQALSRQLKSDRRRIYVEGVSAGAAMSVILGATYPDVFAAIGSIAGCSYRTCGDASGELTHQAMGRHVRVMPVIVENGTADVLNPVAQSEAVVQSWLGADDLADNGQPDDSISRQPETTETTMPRGTPDPGGGDMCVHNNSFLCLGGIAGLSDYPVTVQTWADDTVELYVVHGMAHAQPHAADDGAYTDPLGPDMTTLSYRFFSRHHL
jgi:poly(hydroxyalkanoate) depolymerase family esterase